MADNHTFKDAAGTTQTALAKDTGSSILAQGVVLVDAGGVLVAADDAAAAGPLFPAAGLYQTTPDEVDDGDLGRLRMSARRASVTKPDSNSLVILNNGGTGGAVDGAYRVTQTLTQLSNLRATGFLTGRNRAIFIHNGLDVTTTIDVYAQNGVDGNVASLKIFTASVSAGGSLILWPDDKHSGAVAGNEVIPTFKSGYLGDTFSFAVSMTSPTTGFLSAEAFWEE